MAEIAAEMFTINIILLLVGCEGIYGIVRDWTEAFGRLQKADL
jgi:hypothetical protein